MDYMDVSHTLYYSTETVPAVTLPPAIHHHHHQPLYTSCAGSGDEPIMRPVCNKGKFDSNDNDDGDMT